MPLSRRAFLGSAATAAFLTRRATAWEPSPLAGRARQKGLVYGCCLATPTLADPGFVQAVVREAGLLVPEWEAKRGRIETREGVLDFSAADRLAAFAQFHRMAFRGHALVWHLGNPRWLETVLSAYITRVVAHFRRRVQSWDVVNEAIEVEDGRADRLRASPWLKAFGPGYVDHAFHAARAADPDALLVYNDYGLEMDDPWSEARRRAVLDLLAGMRKSGTPCDALGVQGHLRAFGPRFDPAVFAGFLAEVAAMGYGVIISELDVRDDGGPDDPAARDRAVADLTRRVLDVALAQPRTLGVVTWGLSDRYSWLAGPGKHPRPLPLDRDLRRKPMWQAIAAAFDGASPRPA
jgi:endo-1,4-beta-xylanase